MSFLDLLLIESQRGANFTYVDIRNEVDTFMFEGRVTRSTALPESYCMAMNPTHQDLIHEELDEVFGDSDPPCSIEDAVNLKNLECCIKESMRFFPSVPAIERRATEEFELDGFKIPKYASVMLLIYALHHKAEQYPELMSSNRNASYLIKVLETSIRCCAFQRWTSLLHR